MTFEERIRASLGPRPSKSVRDVMLPIPPGRADYSLNYDWIVDWKPLEGLDFYDGAEMITFLRPDTRTP
jgi:hypothetical protein